jgi:hypothetical protein
MEINHQSPDRQLIPTKPRLLMILKEGGKSFPTLQALTKN